MRTTRMGTITRTMITITTMATTTIIMVMVITITTDDLSGFILRARHFLMEATHDAFR